MDIFDSKPGKWGLRGDPELWRMLQVKFKDYDDPKNEIEFSKQLEREFNSIVQEGNKSSDDTVWIEKFCQSGMSGGQISLEWWQNKGLPLLKARYAKSLQSE